MKKVAELPEASFKSCARGIRKLFIGQDHDLLCARQHRYPSEAEYFGMIDGKTGGLFHLLTRLLMCHLADQKAQNLVYTCVHRLLTALGRHFQVRDHY